MNLRERAAADAKKMLDDLSGAATKFILNGQYTIAGIYGDIGYLLNMSTGEAIEGRTIEAAYSLSTLAEKTEEEPQRGWSFECKDLSEKLLKLFIVKYEPDRTIGIGRLKLAVNLNG